MVFAKFFNKKHTRKSNPDNVVAKAEFHSSLHLEEKIAQLESIRRLNEQIALLSVGISNRFYNEKNSVCHFSVEQLASSFQMTSLVAAANSGSYSTFLKEQMDKLDAIGSEQRRFYYNIHDKVTIPLREWRTGEYHFIRTEIDKLYVYVNKLKTHKYQGADVFSIVYRDRLQMEHDKQLLQVLNQLATLERVQHSHLSVLADLITIIVEYARAVEHVLNPQKDNAETILK